MGPTAIYEDLTRPSQPPANDRDSILNILPYRGYGTHEEVFLTGRVYKQLVFSAKEPSAKILKELFAIGRRFTRWGVGGVKVRAEFNGSQQYARTDRDGYFRFRIKTEQAPAVDSPWQNMDLILPGYPHYEAKAKGEVFVPPNDSRFVVVSDIDDTVMVTGVAQKIKVLWRLFFQQVQNRVAFPGVAAFYRALHRGDSGKEMNPIVYVSRGPWSIYELLDAFFDLHDIPIGPVLFLRDWGFTLQHPLPRQAKGHKLDLIREVLSIYKDLPIVLIGDSGQHDPEIYTRIVQQNPGRVLAVYIRNVSRGAERVRSIDKLARKVLDAGSSLVLAADSLSMAEHAAENSFISKAALESVVKERIKQRDEMDLKPTRKIQRDTIEETREAVEQDKLEAALSDKATRKEPVNVVIEAHDS